MIDKNKIILVTWATWFIWSNLVRKLIELWYNNINIIARNNSNFWRIDDIKDRIKISYVSLLDIENLNNLLLDIKPNIIFHLAAAWANIWRDWRWIIEIFEQNTIWTINLINACKEVWFDYFVNTWSSSEYWEKNKPITENDLLEPNNEYWISKATSSMYASYIWKKYNLPIYTFRLFAVYWYFEDKNRLIPTIMLNYTNWKSPNLTTPNSVRDYIFIDDVIKYYLNINKLSWDFWWVYNIWNWIQYSIWEIVEKIKNISKKKLNANYWAVSIKQNEPKVWLSDNNKTKKAFEIKLTPIDEWLEKSYKWFQKNYNIY